MNIPKIVLILASLSLVLTSYNPADGVEYAYAASLASCPANNVLSWTCGFPCSNLDGYQPFASELFTLSENETLAYSMIFNPSSKKFVTTFRGTVGDYELSLEYTLSNALTYNLSNVSGALVDDYFYDRYVNVFRPSVVANIQKAYALYPDFDFIFTGHSLGAALTTISALDISSNGPVPSCQITIYNYGSPRVGNQAFADAVEAVVPEIYRVTHWKGIVPHLPPCLLGTNGQCTPISNTNSTASLMWPVWHVAQEIFYNEANTNYVQCVGNEDPNCADQFPLDETTWADHGNYVGVQMGC